ncbi:MAG: DUF4202 domain-containing protein [Thermomicrobiaceae bacterium]|nr:DUF4202 domain-containing protein [Thermomicrobiaceae bacterium]
MPTDADLIRRADAWIADYWNADHLRRTLDWLRELDPAPSLALQLAALTHDMERAYPGPDMPKQDARKPAPDLDYTRAHEARSARIVADWLRGEGAPAPLVAEVERLVAVHEEGGWPEADLLQAADSLSFLETNVDLFLGYAAAGKHGYDLPAVRDRFRYMLERIQVPRARDLARPLYEAALARIAAQEAAGAEGARDA